MDAAVDAEVAVDKVPEEERESAALAEGFDVGFFAGLLHSPSEILAASVAASIRLFRLVAAAPISHSR